MRLLSILTLLALVACSDPATQPTPPAAPAPVAKPPPAPVAPVTRTKGPMPRVPGVDEAAAGGLIKGVKAYRAARPKTSLAEAKVYVDIVRDELGLPAAESVRRAVMDGNESVALMEAARISKDAKKAAARVKKYKRLLTPVTEARARELYLLDRQMGLSMAHRLRPEADLSKLVTWLSTAP